jgi:hypothetical protein
MNEILMIFGLGLLCFAAVGISGVGAVQYSGENWSITHIVNPLVDPTTGNPYTSMGDMDQHLYQEYWNSLSPEEQAIADATPAPATTSSVLIDGYPVYPTKDQMVQIILQHMTRGQVAAWLNPEFWAAVVAIGDQDDRSWVEPYVTDFAEAGVVDPTMEQSQHIIDENMTSGEAAAWLDPGFWDEVVAAGGKDDPFWNESFLIPYYEYIGKSLPHSVTLNQADGQTVTVPLDTLATRYVLGESNQSGLTGITYNHGVFESVKMPSLVAVSSRTIPGAIQHFPVTTEGTHLSLYGTLGGSDSGSAMKRLGAEVKESLFRNTGY